MSDASFAAWRRLAGSADVRRAWQERTAALDADLNAFTEIDPERDLDSAGNASAVASNPLAGLPFAVKDNIAVAGFGLSCGSALLHGLVAPYTATAVQRLQQGGSWVVGKTNLDEFGMGSSSQSSCHGAVHNPWDAGTVAGGSSGGSAAAVAAGLVPFALGSDTGGSVRQPASFCGVYGLKPTYGTVSRFGLVAYASSLDVIGVTADSVAVTRAVYDAMRGADARDQTSVDGTAPAPPPGVTAGAGQGKAVIGIPEAALDGIDPAVRAALDRTRERLQAHGHVCKTVSIGDLGPVTPAYYVIATAEASANLARYDGVRYGQRTADADFGPVDAEQMTTAARSAGFSAEVKLRILVGTFVLRSGFQEQYYQRAQRVRTRIREALDAALTEADMLLLPTYPVPPFALGAGGLDPFQQKQSDLFTCTANLTGAPALALPSTIHNGLPIGVQLLGRHFGEHALLDVAAALEAEQPLARPPIYAGPPPLHTGDATAAAASSGRSQGPHE